METSTPDRSIIEVIRILLVVQGAIFVMSSIESLFAVVTQGPAATPIVLLTLGSAVLVLALAWGVGRESRFARKAVLWLEVSLLVWVTIDLALALLLACRGLELVPTLTRIVVPITVFRLLRRPHVQPRFAKKPELEGSQA